MKALLRSARGAALIWSLVFLSMGAGWAQNVGIGTTAPTQTLDVNGNLRVRAAAGTGTGRLLGVEPDGTLKVQPPLFGAAATPSAQAPSLVGSAAATDGEPVKVLLNAAGTRAYVLTTVSLTNPAGQKRASLQAFDVSGPTPVPTGRPVLTVVSGVDMAMNQAGTRAWVLGYDLGSSNGFIQGFDLSQGQPVALGAEAPVGFSPQGIAVNPAGTRAFVWDYAPELLTFDLSQGGTPVQLNALPGVWVSDLAVNPAGTRLFAIDGSQELTTYDLSSGLPVAIGSLVTTGNYLNELTVSPDGTRAYALGRPQLLSFDISSGLPVAVGNSLNAGGFTPYGLTGSANGAVLALQNYAERSLQVYDVDGGGLPVARPAAPGITGGSMALSPDGSRAYLAYAGNTLRTVLLAAPRVLAVGNDGSLGSLDPELFKDNLGNHTATQNLNLAGNQLVSGGTKGLVLDKNGNVGISTGAPSARLDVAGSTRLRGLTTAGVVTTDANGNLGSAAASSLGDNLGNHLATRNLSLGAFQLVGNGGSQGLSISSGGSVGIGTASPAAQLHVATGAVPAAVLEGSTAGPHLELRKPGGGTANIDYIGTDFGGTRGGALELRGVSSVQLSGDGDPSSPDLTVLANGRVGVGTTAPRGLLDVAGTGDTYLVPDLNNGSGQSLFLPGHLWLTPFSGGSGTAFVQARVPNATTNTRIGLTLRTSNGTSLVDALTLAADGSATLASPLTAPAVTSAATGAANLLAAGYGYVNSLGTPTSASANVTVARTGPGEYVLSFAGPLAAADLGSRAVSLTLAGGPGFISFASGSSPGKLLVRTYNTSGTLTDRGFSFVIFQP